MSIESSFILLFCVATAVAIAARRLSVPYTVALVLAGLGVGALHVVAPPHLTKELLFTLLLPGLVFEAAFHLDWEDFRRNALAITALAVPGVIGSIVLTALIATAVIGAFRLESGFTWVYGLVFGAVVAATDPVAVTALFRQLSAPKRLIVLVEAESLLNDGTSIVFFTLILAYVSGAATSVGALSLDFLRVTGGGALVGGIVGLAASLATKHIEDAMIEITLTTIAAYGSFVAAEHLSFSGVIATVVAGMVCGNYGMRVGMSPTTRVAVTTFWEYVGFALNSIVFLLIGFDVSLRSLAASWPEILVAYVAVVVARAGLIAVVTLLLRRTRERMSLRWTPVLTWGGLRGALSMVLALGLPQALPHRATLVTMTVGVVLASLLVQGLTMSPLLRRLGLARRDDELAEHDVARGEVQVAGAAIAELDRMERANAAAPALLRAFRERYEHRAAAARERLEALHLRRQDIHRDESVRTMRHLLLLERDRLAQALRDGAMPPAIYDQLVGDVNARLIRLEEGDYDDVAELVESDRVADSDTAPEPASGTP